jgi:predicted  nucleic acid-binding Zn-ribbon protein
MEDNKQFQNEISTMKNKIRDLNDKLNDSNTANLKLKNQKDLNDLELKNEQNKVIELNNEL